MPFIKLYARDGTLTTEQQWLQTKFKNGVRSIVARHLSCDVPGSDGEASAFEPLDPAEIDLQTIKVESSSGDFSGRDLVVDIEAFDYPARVDDRDAIADRILEDVDGFARDLDIPMSVGVWLKLVLAAWSASSS